MSITYALPEKPLSAPLLTPLIEAEDRLARLDERAALSPLREGWMERLLFHEACACRLAEGDCAPLEDLVLLDGHALDGAASAELSAAWQTLQIWRRATQGEARELLRSPRPGEAVKAPSRPVDAPEYFYDPDWDEAGRLSAWQGVLRESERFPPLLAAALVWDAWLTLMPDQRGAWRGPLLASHALKARGKTNAFLLPLDLGRRFSKYRRHAAHSVTRRLGGFLEWALAAEQKARKDLAALTLAADMLRAKAQNRRRSSRIHGLVDLFLSRPMVSIPMAAKALKVSNQAVAAMLPQLGSLPRELSGRERYRVWGIV